MQFYRGRKLFRAGVVQSWRGQGYLSYQNKLMAGENYILYSYIVTAKTGRRGSSLMLFTPI